MRFFRACAHIIFVVFCLSVSLHLSYASDAFFSDVNKNSAFYFPLQHLKEKKLIEGYSDGSFHPEKSVTRAEALAMILKASGQSYHEQKDNGALHIVSQDAPLIIKLPKKTSITLENSLTGEKKIIENINQFEIHALKGTAQLRKIDKKKSPRFKDVLQRDWFFEMVSYAADRGIVTGVSDTRFFEPSREVTLAEALRMLFASSETSVDAGNATNLPPGVSTQEWFAADLGYAISRSMVTQKSDGSTFAPGAPLSRGQLALLLYRYLKVQEGATFGYASWYGDGLAKTKLTSNKEYADKFLTAAHRTLPFGTLLRVRNVSNGKSVDVVVNDRGPFVTGRIIDLSKSAFSALESTSAGVVSVEINVVK